jgi:hypothetical protein
LIDYLGSGNIFAIYKRNTFNRNEFEDGWKLIEEEENTSVKLAISSF